MAVSKCYRPLKIERKVTKKLGDLRFRLFTELSVPWLNERNLLLLPRPLLSIRVKAICSMGIAFHFAPFLVNKTRNSHSRPSTFSPIVPGKNRPTQHPEHFAFNLTRKILVVRLVSPLRMKCFLKKELEID